MADKIDYKLVGNDMQLVEIHLDPEEGIRSEAGAMLYMDDGIEMKTGTEGGILKGIKRSFTGESFFITTFTNQGSGKQMVSFGAPYPGKIIPIDLSKFKGKFICQRDSYLCSASGIEVEVEFTRKLGAGFFGGEGFILQRLEGDGLAFVHAGGTVVERDLKEGEVLKVDTGCLVGFSQTVEYNVGMVKGFRNMLFGGEGLFLATLRGPGKVYLQSLPLARLAGRIIASTGSRTNR